LAAVDGDERSRDPAFDAALSQATLTRVARGELAPAIRLYRPAPAVQFGRLDRRRPGFAAAARAARAHGFEPLVRVVGGLAAAHDDQSLVLDHYAAADFASDLHGRFDRMARRIVAALVSVGVDARIGAIADEYCPGSYSINSAGTLKVSGLAQRVVRGAALTSAVIVVGNGDRIRSVLVDVYRELGVEWDPATAGALEDHHAGVSVADVERALLAAFAGEPLWAADEATLALAGRLAAEHRGPA
jgi:lipoate-protein ligase A